MVDPSPLATAVPRCDPANFLCWIGDFHDGAATMASLASTIAYGVGLIGIVVAVRQYRATEKWKRAEFIASALQTFREDEEVNQVVSMMDYRGNEINFGTIERPNNVRVFHASEQDGHGTGISSTDIRTALGFHGTPGWAMSPLDLGSGLIDHSQKMTAAAMQIAEK
jgi:hypothetical protein